MMKIIFFGLGSIGQRHAKILIDHFDHELFAFRHDPGNSSNRLGIPEIYTWKAIEQLKPDIAFITNPTFLHVKTAIQCARLGAHLFIEKPLSHNLENLDLLTSLCQKNQLACYTAYGLRFHPVIGFIRDFIQDKKVKHARVTCSSYLPHWRNQEVKNSYSVSKEQGGGVLLDLSHEFDYIQYLFGSINHMIGQHGKISHVTIDAEDYADVFIETTKNIFINLHLNFFSLLEKRDMVINYDGGYIEADLLKGKVDIFHQGQLQTKQFSVDRDDYLKEQLNYFFDHLNSGEMMNNLLEARQLLSKIVAFKRYESEKVSA